MNLNKDKLYIKVVAFDVIYNFIVEKFMNWNYLWSKNIILSVQILKFKIYNYQTISDVDMVYMKVTVLDRIYNVVVEIFLIWICLDSQTCVPRLWILKFKILNS